jgi:hypothetical protein
LDEKRETVLNLLTSATDIRRFLAVSGKLSGNFSNPICRGAYALFFDKVSCCRVALCIGGGDHAILFQYFVLQKRRKVINENAGKISSCHAERAVTGSTHCLANFCISARPLGVSRITKSKT